MDHNHRLNSLLMAMKPFFASKKQEASRRDYTELITEVKAMSNINLVVDSTMKRIALENQLMPFPPMEESMLDASPKQAK